MPISYSIDMTAPVALYVVLRGGVGGVLTIQVLNAGSPVNLTGAAIRYVANTSSQIIKTVGSGIDITLPLLGVFTLTYTDADTIARNVTQGVEHECKIQQLGGVPVAVFEGKLMIEASLFTTV